MMVWAVSLSSTDLSTDVLTAVIVFAVFVVYEGWVRLPAPVLNRALPPQNMVNHVVTLLLAKSWIFRP